MAQITLGKDIPNLKITLPNNDKPIEILEEGEIRDDEDCVNGTKKLVHQQYPPIELEKPVRVYRKFISFENFRRYENKAGAFATGLDLSSEDIPKKLEDRAARFGVENCSQRTVSQVEIKELYESLGIYNAASSWESNNFHLDTVHIRGVNEMSTDDIFTYFEKYGPKGAAWINDCSCNVQWVDNMGAARALLGLSTVLKIQKVPQATPQTIKALSETEADQIEDMVIDAKDEVPEMDEVVLVSDMSSDDDDEDKLVAFKHQKSEPNDDDQMDVDPCENEPQKKDQNNLPDIPIPPGHWRLGIPFPKAKAILLRFAVKDDIKLPGAEKRSEYYQKYGNPNYGGMKGVISSTKKRKIMAMKNRAGIEQLSKASGSSEAEMKFDDESAPNPKRRSSIRMRMYADDEEERIKRAARLRQNVSVHDRLGDCELRSDRDNFEDGRWQHDKHEEHERNEDHHGKNESHYERNENHHERNEDHYASNDLEDVEEETYSVRSAISKPDSNQNVSSRYNVWTDLAESMADDCSGEGSEGKINRRREWWNNTKFSRTSEDLRNKLHSSFSVAKPWSSSSQGIDLRSKLDKIRKSDNVSKHRSPLLIGDEKRSERDEKRSERDEKRSERDEKRSERDEKRSDRDEKRSDRDEKRSERHYKRSEKDEKRSESD